MRFPGRHIVTGSAVWITGSGPVLTAWLRPESSLTEYRLPFKALPETYGFKPDGSGLDRAIQGLKPDVLLDAPVKPWHDVEGFWTFDSDH